MRPSDYTKQYVKETPMFIIIMQDKFLVKNVTEHETFANAKFYADTLNVSNPNAVSIEILSRANGALLKKVK